MSEEIKKTSHCGQCGEVFKSRIKPVSELKCTACGLSPVRTRFAQLTDMPALDHAALDLDHGVAGKDAADFVSMQRKAKQRRAMMMYAGWVVLLLVIGGVGYYVKEQKRNKVDDKTLLSRTSWQFQEREKRAADQSAATFKKFANAVTGNSRAIYTADGTEYLLDMRRYYSNPLNNIVKYDTARMIDYRLEEVDGHEKLDAKFEIREGKILRKFEAVFWKQDEKWLLDWAQFVRIGEMPWADFIEQKDTLVPQKFMLYVRVPDTTASVVGYTDLIFAEPLNDHSKPYDHSTNVLVKDSTQLKQDILDLIKNKKKRDRDDKLVLESFDPVFMARVQVTIGYEMINGEKLLVLKELNKTDWVTTPEFE